MKNLMLPTLTVLALIASGSCAGVHGAGAKAVKKTHRAGGKPHASGLDQVNDDTYTDDLDDHTWELDDDGDSDRDDDGDSDRDDDGDSDRDDDGVGNRDDDGDGDRDDDGDGHDDQGDDRHNDDDGPEEIDDDYTTPDEPSLEPTSLRPSTAPSPEPTAEPTRVPTPSPTGAPSHAPSSAPSHSPSHSPTDAPSRLPTVYPSLPPTHSPTMPPSHIPTVSPSKTPTPLPTNTPTPIPSSSPTTSPTTAPTPAPTMLPSPSPSPKPTSFPTPSPTAAPTYVPTAVPTVGPTPYPSPVPTMFPSPLPTMLPSSFPTVNPTFTPTFGPTPFPSPAPTPLPTGHGGPIGLKPPCYNLCESSIANITADFEWTSHKILYQLNEIIETLEARFTTAALKREFVLIQLSIKDALMPLKIESEALEMEYDGKLKLLSQSENLGVSSDDTGANSTPLTIEFTTLSTMLAMLVGMIVANIPSISRDSPRWRWPFNGLAKEPADTNRLPDQSNGMATGEYPRGNLLQKSSPGYTSFAYLQGERGED